MEPLLVVVVIQAQKAESINKMTEYYDKIANRNLDENTNKQALLADPARRIEFAEEQARLLADAGIVKWKRCFEDLVVRLLLNMILWKQLMKNFPPRV